MNMDGSSKPQRKRIWLIIQDNSLPEYGSQGRHYYFAKYLARKGYEPVVFVASYARCSGRQLIQDNSPFLVDSSCGFPWVYVRTNNFGESMKKRLVAIAEFHMRLHRLIPQFVDRFGVPDVILGSSCYPISPTLAIKTAKKLHVKSICEIRDLWPASLEDYGIIKRGGFIAKAMYRLERYNYEHADSIIFTMEGGADYIRDMGWDTAQGGKIDLDKVHYINNGIDLEAFDANINDYSYVNPEINREDKRDFARIGYAGSIRKANNIGFIVDVAEVMKDEPVRFFIMGDGGERTSLEQRVKDEGLDNVVFTGRIAKNFIPSALSQMMMMMMYSSSQNNLSKYGMSQNKLFDYLAAGKPIISNLPSRYSVINGNDCGIERIYDSPEDCADTIRRMLSDQDSINRWSSNSKISALEFSFDKLSDKLIEILEDLETK